MTIAPGFMDLLSNFRNNLAGGSVELKVNTNDLINAASDIEKRVNGILQELSDMFSVVNQTGGYWEGTVSEICRNDYQLRNENMTAAFDRIRSYVTILQKISETYTTTEEQNVEDADALPSGIIY